MSIFLVSTDKMATLEDGSKTITLANSFMVELTPELEEKIKYKVIEKLGEWHAELIKKHYPEPAPIQCEEETISLVFQKLRSLV